MARPKKTTEPIIIDDVSDASMDEVFGVIDELNPDASLLSENSLANVDEYIDTGNYSLNAIISGSVFGGVPIGRLCGFFGPPATGKTLIVNKIIANAQKQYGLRPIYFDSEQALDKMVASRLGCDITKIKHAPVELIEECKTQIMTTLTKCIDLGLKKKIIICIDSVGGLNTSKELNDALTGKNASDMGLRAKQLKSMMNKLTFRAAKSETPIIFTNHIYESVGDLYPSLVKKQPGGMSPLFIASLLVQLSTKNIKVGDEKGEIGKLSDKISGVNLRAFVTKNRFVPPYLSTEMYLNFKTGLDRYSGLLDLAVKMDLIKRTGSTYVLNDEEGTKLGYSSKFENDPDFWENGMLEKLDKILKKELHYSNDEFDEIETEVNELTKEIINDTESDE
jgi:recombination protein RecA